MNDSRPTPPLQVPTLTEVVPESSAGDGMRSAVVLPLHRPPVPAAGIDSFAADPVDADAVFMEVLGELRTQVDRLIDYRLREALAPVVARAVDQLVDDAKQELQATLTDVLRRSVAQVIARNRPR